MPRDNLIFIGGLTRTGYFMEKGSVWSAGVHDGIDVKAQIFGNNDVHPIAMGEVISVHDKDDSVLGKYVEVWHKDLGLLSRYAHLKEIPKNIRTGKIVNSTTKIGVMGTTNGTPEGTSPHVHLNVGVTLSDSPKLWLKGQDNSIYKNVRGWVDPEPFLRMKAESYGNPKLVKNE